MAELTLLGMAELHRALQDLPVKIERNILRGALRAGAKVYRDAALRTVPRRTGALAKSIRVSVRLSRKTGRLNARIIAGNKAAYYAHMVEYGTERHIIKAKARRGALAINGRFVGGEVEHPGFSERPFMRPAFDAASGGALAAFADYVRNRIGKEISKQSGLR